MRLSNVPVPEPYLVGLGVGVVLSRQRLRPLPLPSSVRLAMGLPLATAGVALVGAAVKSAEQVNVADPERLLTAGPYARTRNPMYVGWGLVHLGIGVAFGSVELLATLPLAATWVHRDVLAEERVLRRRFGREFEAYRAAVPRYLSRTAPGRAEPGRRS
jgi:protein-S-isoprenylcysteine O-methyltransferase Ste14